MHFFSVTLLIALLSACEPGEQESDRRESGNDFVSSEVATTSGAAQSATGAGGDQSNAGGGSGANSDSGNSDNSDNSDNSTSSLSAKDVLTCFVREASNQDQYYYLLTGIDGIWTETLIGLADQVYGSPVCNLLIAPNGDITVFNSASEWRIEAYKRLNNETTWGYLNIDWFETVEEQKFDQPPIAIIGHDGLPLFTYVQFDDASPLSNGDHGLFSVWQPPPAPDHLVMMDDSSEYNPYSKYHTARDSNDNIHLVVQHFNQQESKYSLQYTQYGNSWAPLSSISSIIAGGHLDPYLVIDPQDDLHLFYRIDNGTTCDLRHIVRNQTSGLWQNDEKILEFGPTGECGGSILELTADPLGNFYIGYRKTVEGAGILYLASFDGSSLSEEPVVTAAAHNVDAVNIVSDGLTVTILYVDRTNPSVLAIRNATKDLTTSQWESTYQNSDFNESFTRDATALSNL
jgi:hypothetical protein